MKMKKKKMIEEIMKICSDGCLGCAVIDLQRTYVLRNIPDATFLPSLDNEHLDALFDTVSSMKMHSGFHTFCYTSRCDHHWTSDRGAMKSIDNILSYPTGLINLFRMSNGAKPLCTTQAHWCNDRKDDVCIWCKHDYKLCMECQERPHEEAGAGLYCEPCWETDFPKSKWDKNIQEEYQ